MQTDAEIAVDGKTAKLTKGGKTLLATIVSPASATFTSAKPPEPANPNPQARDLTKINVLRASVPEAKGPQSLCITFTTALEAPAHTPQPIAEWVKVK
jgi:hypothetical protein